MPSASQLYNRHSIRLPGYDYSQAGAYFVTIVSHNRLRLFGNIVNKEMKLNHYGEIVRHAWYDLPHHYRYLQLGAFVVMPNHVHGILILTDQFKSPSRHGIPEIVRAFKTFSARRINHLRKMQGSPVWHRNYYEHIIRNNQELERITYYIENNPANWKEETQVQTGT